MEAEEDIIELEEKTRIGVAIIAQQDLDKLEESDSESNGSNSESNSELPEQIQSQLNAIVNPEALDYFRTIDELKF